MKQKFRSMTGLAALVALGSCVAVLASDPAFYDGFESYAIDVALPEMNGWSVSTNAVVVQTNSAAASTTNAVMLPSETSVTNAVGATGINAAWTDLQVSDASLMLPEAVTAVAVNTNATVMVYLDTNSAMVVYDGSVSNWVVCSNDIWGVGVSNFFMGGWARLSVYTDYQSKKTAIFLNDHLMRQQVGFINTNVTAYNRFKLDSGEDSATYLDEISVISALPAGLTNDLDVDGMADVREIQNYGNVSTWGSTVSNNMVLAGQDVVLNGSLTVTGGVTLTVTTNLTVTGTVSLAEGSAVVVSNAVVLCDMLILDGTATVQVVEGTLLANGRTLTGSYTLDTNLWGHITVSAATSNGDVNCSVTPTSVSGLYYLDTTNFTITAGTGYYIANVYTNGVVATNYSGRPMTAGYEWPGIPGNGILTAGFARSGAIRVPQDYASITAALAMVQAGEQVTVSNGVYDESVVVSNGVMLVSTNLSGDGTNLAITGSVAIRSGGSIVFGGGTVTFGALTLDGGTVVISNGTLTANGLSRSGTFTLSDWGVVHGVPLPYAEPFERHGDGTMLVAMGDLGWGGSTDVLVKAGVGYGGSHGLMLPVDSAVSNTAAANVLSNLWVDVYVAQATLMVPDAPVVVNTNSIVQLYIDTNGYVVVYDAVGSRWTACTNDPLGNPTAGFYTGGWARLSIHEDFTRTNVAVFLNGHLVVEQLRFIDPTMSSHTRIRLDGGEGSPTFFDSLSISNGVPPALAPDSVLDWACVLEIERFGTVLGPHGSIYTIR